MAGWLAARAGAGGERTDAVIEAAALAAGLEARRAGLGPPVRQVGGPPRVVDRTGGTIDADVAWLLRVAEAFDALGAADVPGTGPGGGRGGRGADAGKEKPRPGRGDQTGAVTR